MRARIRQLIWVVGTLGLASAALARAGGGQHYSSSSQGGGGGGGDGGFLIQVLFEMIRLTIAYPLVMLPVWVVVFLLFASYTHFSAGQRGSRAYAEMAPLDPPDIGNRVTASDPTFDLGAFRGRAKRIFLSVQEAWFKRDLPSARALISDGVLGRFTAQQQLMELEGSRNALADMQVLDLTIIDRASSPFFQLVDVLFEAQARDVDVPVGWTDAQALARAQRASLNRFTEVWTFARRPGATPRGDSTQGRCPNCGADYPGGATAQCAYCQAIINSGHYDWVLCAITQTQERHLGRSLTDFSALLARDPGFNPFALEDRAALCFWKLLLAKAQANGATLQRCASPELREELAPTFDDLSAAGMRWSYREAAVGSAELVALDLGGPGDFDRAHIKVKWSARAGRVARGKAAGTLEPVILRTLVLTLSRSSGAKTSPNQGLATDRCGHCGAAVDSDAELKCSYCGTGLGSGEGEWVLSAEEPLEVWRSGRSNAVQVPRSVPEGAGATAPGLPRAASTHERERILVAMAAMARADGLVRPADRRLLLEFATRWHVSAASVQSALDHVGTVQVDVPTRGTPGADAFFEGVVALALADGRVDSRETSLMDLAIRELHLPPARLEQALDAQRT